MRPALLILLSFSCAFLLCACSSFSYYRQLASGHFAVMGNATPLDKALETATPATADKLRLIQQARDFAEQELKLAASGSYESYVDLDRSYVVQNLYAAPEFSTDLKHWCYPLVGCAAYRGYFDESQLHREQLRLSREGFDTHKAPAIAYSTLGWFDDPVLNTFVALPDHQIVALIFHELAHQRLYLRGDTEFNESFATAIERAGLRAFYSNPDAPELKAYDAQLATSRRINALAQTTREDLAQFYRQNLPDADKRARKAALLAAASRVYAEIIGREIAPLNNASLGLINTYGGLVPGFEAILESVHGDVEEFAARVQSISRLDEIERHSCLHAWGDPDRPGQAKPQCWE